MKAILIRLSFIMTALLACSSFAVAHAHDVAEPGMASEPGVSDDATSVSPIAVPIDTAALAVFPRESVVATAHEQTLRCEGVPLTALLRAAQAMPVGALRGARLASYVLVTARDGYRAVYALADFDPSLGNRKVYLVDRCDGKPLDDHDGPLRLLAPDESRPARWVRQVQSIAVVAAP
ncbi:MAG: hypothetical protein ABJA62_06325 [Luteimonas sp.]